MRAFTFEMGDRQAQKAADEVLQNFNVGILTGIFMMALRTNMQDHINFQYAAMKDKQMTLQMSPVFFTMMKEQKLKYVLDCELSYE